MSSHVGYSIKRPRKACYCAIMLPSNSGHCALNSVRRRDGLTDRSLSRLPLILSTFPTHQNFSPQNFSAIFFPGKTSVFFLRNILLINRNNTQHDNSLNQNLVNFSAYFFQYFVHLIFQSLRYKAISSAKLALFIPSLKCRHIVLSLSGSAWIYLLVFVVSLEEASGRSLICLAATLSPSDLAPDTLDQPNQTTTTTTFSNLTTM